MQKMGLEIIKMARKEKMEKLENSMKEVMVANKDGAVFFCPYCNYSSRKNSKGSAKVFQGKFFKCFSCGIWRKI